MSEPLYCATCAHWQGDDSRASADCALKVYTGLVPFNRCDPPCPQHSGAPKPPAVDMQSQARGVLYQMWGVKP